MKKEISIIQERDEPIPFKYSITSYGADFDIDGLVKRLQREDIFIPPFQRSYVWTFTQASRFVESLLLGLPVPGIFLSREESSQKLLVIDGQQRLLSLLYFYQGIFVPKGREFKLTGIKSRFEGKAYRNLMPEDRRRLDDSIIHATIVRQDEPDDGSSSIFLVFERLNTGGTQLQPQEIRSALFHGEFNVLLTELNSEPTWRNLYGPISPRKRDVELILRYFALLHESDSYEKPIKEFLNVFMGSNRNFNKYSKEDLQNEFLTTISAIEKFFGNRAFKPKRALNAAIFDSLMVGLSRRLRKGEIEDEEEIKIRYNDLLRDPEYEKVTETGTSDEDIVRRRMELATRAFEDVK